MMRSESKALENLTLESILLSKRITKLNYTPFCYFKVDNYLPDATYEFLCETYPQSDQFPERIVNYKSYLPNSSEAFMEYYRTNLVMKKLVDLMRSNEFMQDAHSVFWKGLIQSRGLAGVKKWVDMANTKPEFFDRWFERKWKQPVYSNFEFTEMQQGDSLEPHTDGMHKLVSLLLYFPTSDWKSEYQGGTAFYRAPSSEIASRWSNYQNNKLTEEKVQHFHKEMEGFHVAEFLPNRLVGFLKAKLSYHSVPSIQCPESLRRRTFNININTGYPNYRSPFNTET